MQDLAHLIVHGEKILVLRRSRKLGVSLKIRKTGKDGKYLDDYSEYYESEPEELERLKRGEVLKH